MLMGCSVLTENKASNKDEFISLSAYSPKGGGKNTVCYDSQLRSKQNCMGRKLARSNME